MDNSIKRPRTLDVRQQRRSLQDDGDTDGVNRLEGVIKRAYVLKSLKAQLAEQEAQRMSDAIQARIDEQFTEYRTNEEQEARDQRERTEKLRRTSEYKSELERQVDEKKSKYYLIEEEERRERKVLLAVDRLREKREQREKSRIREQQADQLILEDLIQKEMKEVNRTKQVELGVMELEKNQKYLEELEKRTAKIAKFRETKAKEQEELIIKAAKMLTELQSAREERRALLTELLIADVKRDIEHETRNDELRNRQRAEELVRSLEEQIQFEKECKRRFLEREKAFSESIMAKVMMSERMERATAEVRRRYRLEYRSELEQMMNERERSREEEVARLKSEMKDKQRKEERDREEVKRMRKRLLKDHVGYVAEYMSRASLNVEERKIVEESLSKE